MGGATSEISDGTTDVIVESAIFDPISIRRTAFRYALRSEASLRFEKGQEHRLARLGADRTARLIAEWAGGRVAAGRHRHQPDRTATGAGCVPAVARQPAARRGAADRGTARPPGPCRRHHRGGSPGTRIAVAAEPMPLEVDAGDAETLVATIPSWRRDLAIEADITEEVARVRGYDVVPDLLPRHADAPLPALPVAIAAPASARRSRGPGSPRR